MPDSNDHAADDKVPLAELVQATILDTMNDAIYVRDRNRKLLYINPAAERLTGWSVQEALAQPCYKTFGDPGEACNRVCPIDRCIDLEQGTEHSQGHLVRRDGSVLDMRVSMAPLKDGDEVVGAVVALQDISELRASEERFKDFAEAASDWLWETDEELRFTEVKGRPPISDGLDARLSLGKTREELADTSDDAEKWRRYRADMEARRGFSNFQYRRVNDDGTVIHLRVSGKPLFDGAGRFRGYRGVGSNVTALVEAEQQARSAELQLATAIDNISETLALYDADDRLLLANRAWRERNAALGEVAAPGRTFEDITRAGLAAGLFPESEADEAGWLVRRLAHHRNPSTPFEVTRGDGSSAVVQEYRVLDGSTLTITTDITKLKLAEEVAAQRLHQLALHFENTPMASTGWDTELICTSWNSAAEEIFGYTAEEAVGRPSVDLIVPEADRDEVRELLHAIMGGKGESDRHRVNQNLTKDGRVITCEWFHTSLLDDDGSVVGMAALASDISDKLKAEEELQFAKKAAEDANRAKSEFLSSMSHELRTPLNAILGFGQLLEQYSDDPLTEDQGAYVEHMLDGARHLLGLINEVLDLAKIEAGQLDLSLETIDPGGVVEDSVTLVRSLADERGSGTVSVNATTGNAGMMRISVSDTGAGISADKYDEVFRPFSRLDAQASKIEGTGIGLAISRQLIESMGGRIDFESSLGEGSTFWIEIPLDEA